jgi:hypothetical protein
MAQERGAGGEAQNVYIAWLIAVDVEERVRHFYHSIEHTMRLLMDVNSVCRLDTQLNGFKLLCN